MKHYRLEHAVGSILCNICDFPIRSPNGPNNFREHYARKHPNITVPFGFGPFRSQIIRKKTNAQPLQVSIV